MGTPADIPAAGADKLLDGFVSPGTGSDFYGPHDRRILGWVKEALEEGERLNRTDPAYPGIDETMEYVLGNQLGQNRPSYLPNVVVNRTKKAIRTHASALTDIRPLFAYKTFNDRFETHGYLLNKLVILWWMNTFADLRLRDCILYSLTAGAGDLVCEWDPNFHQGNTRLSARDPRDTLPIRPSREDSVQSWMGLIIREAHSPAAMRATYPHLKDVFQPDVQKWGQVYTRFRRYLSMITPVSTLDGLSTKQKGGAGSSPEVIAYRVYLNDMQINLNTKKVLMGQPGTNWCYWVEPGKPLYPRKRLIVCTEKAILYDGPNQYWHGMYPLARLKLDPWPWTFLGLGLVHDARPLQNAINSLSNDVLTWCSQVVNRGLIADKNAVPESQFKRFDPRRPNWKVRVNTALGEGFKLQDPSPMPPQMLEFLTQLYGQFDDLTEMANLQNLMQLNQMPSGDTIAEYYKALTPGLKMEGRLLEAFLRDVAEMVKSNIFQFMSTERRMLYLGDAGKTLEDFDYAPGSLVPSMAPQDKGYVPELDKDLPHDQRAQYFQKLFTFYVSPNSLLAMHAQEEQMKYTQLAQQGYMDFWTLMEMKEIPNVGRPPMVPLPMKDYKPPPPKTDPQTGQPMPTPPPPMEIREPVTITERLIAQQQLGLSQTVSAQGRKASNQKPPQMEQRPDGSTTTVTS